MHKHKRLTRAEINRRVQDLSAQIVAGEQKIFTSTEGMLKWRERRKALEHRIDVYLSACPGTTRYHEKQ